MNELKKKKKYILLMPVGEEDITWCRTTRGPFFGENGAMNSSLRICLASVTPWGKVCGGSCGAWINRKVQAAHAPYSGLEFVDVLET